MQKKINKERIEDNQSGLVLASSKNEPSAEDLRIDWSSFIRFFNETLKEHKRSIPPIEWLSKGMKPGG